MVSHDHQEASHDHWEQYKLTTLALYTYKFSRYVIFVILTVNLATTKFSLLKFYRQNFGLHQLECWIHTQMTLMASFNLTSWGNLKNGHCLVRAKYTFKSICIALIETVIYPGGNFETSNVVDIAIICRLWYP